MSFVFRLVAPEPFDTVYPFPISMKNIAALLLLALASVVPLRARIDLLLVPPEHAVTLAPGFEFTVHLNNPTDAPEIALLPAVVEAEYASQSGPGHLTLEVIGGNRTLSVAAMHRTEIRLRVTQPIKAAGGFVSLRLINPVSNAIMFELAGVPPPAAPAPGLFQPAPHIDLASDVETMRRHISGYDPIYFAIGSRERLNARFQFSFKYRVFEHGIAAEPWWKDLGRDVYVAYTQVSIWDLQSFSKPFYDTSYKPTVFVLHEFERAPGDAWTFSLQSGAQHESNGKGGGAAPVATPNGLISGANTLRHPLDTRSLNTLYVMPQVRWSDDAGWFFSARARASAYFQIDENPDIARYRGYVELTVKGGYDRGPQIAVILRGDGNRGSVDFNFTWPANQTPLLKHIDFLRSLGGYAQIQYFNGYGESLLDYDVRRRDQLRFGVMIVR